MSHHPQLKPNRPNFSSGPCAKIPGWSFDKISTEMLGRSHRSKSAQDRIDLLLEKTRQLLKIPDNYYVCITPGSATGAMEMLIWNLIGAKGVDALTWDLFGSMWAHDIKSRLPIGDYNIYEGTVDHLPDLNLVDPNRDVIFTWNGSTSGMAVPNLDWISDERTGLSFCDATSSMFAYDVDWHKLDATAFSWQKCLGGEAAHGMIVLSPRAYERLQSYTPTWPIPLLLRMKFDGQIVKTFFQGWTMNTPSMMCVEDFIVSLNWAEKVGGLPELCRRSLLNKSLVEEWVQAHPVMDFAAKVAETRSRTTVCFKPASQDFINLSDDKKWQKIIQVTDFLDKEGVAYDIKGHRNWKPGFRIWCGPTVEADDVKAVLPWIDWAWSNV